MSEPLSKRLSTKQAAEYLGLSESYLNKDRLVSAQIPFLKIGSRVIYELADLDAFLATRRRKSTADDSAQRAA